MRVFGIGAGRAGSVTFTLAMAKAGNYTTGHESHRGDFRAMSSLDYPDSHVEVDNRLSWFLPALGEKYPDDVLWVHLRRDLEMQAISYSKRNRWNGALNRPGESGDSSPWEGWGHVRENVEEVPGRAA